MFMVEQEMKIVNCLMAYSWEMIKTYQQIHCRQYSIRMNAIGNTGLPPSPQLQMPLVAARCVNGNLVRPDNAEEEPPSTACADRV